MKVKIDSLERLAIKEGITDVEFEARQAILANLAPQVEEVEDVIFYDDTPSWDERDEGRLITQAMEAVEAQSAPLGW